MHAVDLMRQQRRLYEGSFYQRHRWRWTFRDDCRYRKNRLFELLHALGVPLSRARVFELGFGAGDLLFQFPTGCTLMGVELSAAAVSAVGADPRMTRYRDHWLRTVDAGGALPLPPQPVDLAVASHVFEHVPDDQAVATQMARMLAPGGLLAVFVPIEPPGFDPKHVRTYTVAGLTALLEACGLDVVHAEANYHIRSGPLRWLDHPARHDWPVLAWLEGLRDLFLTVIPYPLTRGLEELLIHAGVPGTQAMVLAKRPAP